MSKKNLCPPKRDYTTHVLGYSLPVYHPDGKKVYVDFTTWDASRGKMRRKKIHLDKYKSKLQRNLYARELIEELIVKLRSGWNPWSENVLSRGYTSIEEVADKYIEYVRKTGRKKTLQSYSSRVKVLLEYNRTRINPIHSAHEYDRGFITDFLDWVLLDRDTGPRTRNNYRGWCSALGDFMVQRKYIESNPAEGIPKIPEDVKVRKPLTVSMMRKLKKYLSEEDPHFLLAVMMEYYTFIRPTELSNLRLCDFELKKQRVFVSKEFSKNKRDAYVGINATIIRMMVKLDIFKSPGNWYLFGKNFRPAPEKWDPDRFNKRWVTMRKKLGWGEEYQFYSLKDTGIRDLANAAGIVIARDQARHTDISTTNKYLGIEKDIHAETKNFKGAFEEDPGQNL